MTQKTKVQIEEGLAYMIEDAIERYEPVMAATGITDKLQKMLEDLGKILPDDIMPMQDKLSKHFGPDVATKFTQAATEQVNQAIAALTSAKMALDGEIKRLEKGVDGGDMSDMATDGEPAPMPSAVPPGAPEGPPAPPGPGGPPGGEAPQAGMPDMPLDAGNAEDDMAGGFAGRPRKESAEPRGKKIIEDFNDDAPFGRVGVPKPQAPAAHPYKGDFFHGNLDNLKAFHGGLGRLARNVEQMIDSGKLNGAEREGLANTLSHMASTGHDAGHWVDPEAKLATSLKANHITDTADSNVALIIHELRKLAHGLALKHSSVMENSIIALRKAANPDALVFKTFRKKLAEGRDAQMAAIRTARQFAIDVDDVVMVVKEAAKNPFADWLKTKDDDDTESDTKDDKKAKKDDKKKSKKPWEKDKVSEDVAPMGAPDMPQGGQGAMPQQNSAPQSGVPIFPVSQNAPAVANTPMTASTSSPVMTGEPNWNTGSQSNSTRKPMTPGDKRAAVTQQNMAQVSQPPGKGQPSQPSPPMKQPAPTNQEGQPAFDQKKRKIMAGTGTSPQPNIR